MGQELINAVQIDCDSPESLRLENSGTDRTNQIIFLLPSWAMSLLAHVILLLLLACVTFPAVGDSLPRILTILPTNESQEDEPPMVQMKLDQNKISTEQVLESYVGGFDDTVHFDGAAELIDDVFDATQLVVEIEDVPEFFGAYGKGERYAFVIDRSSSMTGEKFEVAKKELVKALKQLRSHQHFYIVFFDRGVLQMLGRKNVKDMLPATPKNLRQVEYWIRRVKVGSGTKPYQSIRLALALSPDTMFLLSDGQFNSGDNTVSYLIENRTIDGEKFDREATEMKLNTIGFYHKGDGTLQRLAEKFNGTYRFVDGADR